MKKCPKCGQHIFNNYDYCINCGAELNENIKEGISLKTFIIVVSIFLVVGISLILGIMYWGTDKELQKFIEEENNQQKENDKKDYKESNIDKIKKYYGNYIIFDIFTTNKSPSQIIENKEEYIGWPVDFFEDSIKLSIYQIDWLILKDLKVFIYTKDDKQYEQFEELKKVDLDFIIEGTAPAFNNKKYQFNFIISNNNIYIYAYDTLFKLKKIEVPYKNNNNFYKLSLPKETFTNEEINKKLNEFINEFNNIVENDSNYVIYYHYDKIIDDEMLYIILIKSISEPFGHTFINYETIGYNYDTDQIIDLITYINENNLNIEEIESKYKQKWEELEIYSPFKNLEPNTPYYTKENTLHIMVEGQDIIIEL